MTCGIYMLIFGDDYTKVYVGKSKNIEKRYSTHIRLLQNNNHTIKLQKAYIDSASIPDLYLLITCDTNKLDYYEHYYITTYNTVTNGLNTVAPSIDLDVESSSSIPTLVSKITKDPHRMLARFPGILGMGIKHKPKIRIPDPRELYDGNRYETQEYFTLQRIVDGRNTLSKSIPPPK